tara:strand:+ start:219 stop:905 length:687 start_codon:yes stop_codon:yes gene_type:complete
MADATLWSDLIAFGLGVAISPLHIAVLLLLLLGPSPLRRGGLFLAAWVLTNLVTLLVLLTLGHGLVLDMTHGSHPRTGLDLLGGGALLTLGSRELLSAITGRHTPPAWTHSVDRLTAMPLALLIVLSSVVQVITPDDLLLFAKAASVLLAAGMPFGQELIGSATFTLTASALMLLPCLAVLIGRAQVVPVLQRCKQLLFDRGELVVSGVSLVLGGYLSWQGITGLTRI